MLTVLSFVVLILSVIAHEVAHGYAADALGDPTARLSGRLTLNPLPHIDLMGSIVIPAFLVFSGSSMLFGWAKPVPYNPYNLKNRRWGECLVAGAGSATNLFLALLFSLLIRFGAPWLSPGALSLAASIVLVNLFLGLFNLIPFPPLDGFTVLKTALPWHLGTRLEHVERQIRTMGFFSLLIFLFVFSALLAGPFFAFVTRLFFMLTGMSL